jgi:anti-sigma B factor antagonist
MTLTFEIPPGGGPVRLAGSIDRDSGPQLDALYSAAGGGALLDLDFAAVDYINSSGIALIVGVLVRARTDGTAVRAAGLTPHYIHIFEITRLSDFLEVVQPARG